ncbi:MAG: malto-oligosyltrehalose trehalohydrolase [Terracidiphilus sp.]|jgi:maltooligosyltrehalose trehalohydrolase
MHRFELWAPKAKTLTLVLNEASTSMEGPDGHGWWRLDVADAHPGLNYAYLVDDDPVPYPDPRSQWQPGGVHDRSRIYDQSAFAWSDQGFKPAPLTSAIIYELHIGTFTPQGTFDSAIEKLAYLADLGVTHVELMPVAAFAGDHGWGYDGVSLYAVHEPYGGPDALKGFVNAAHSIGLAVLLDVVYNHFGPVGNYSGKFGPYLTEAHRTPWGGAVNLEESGSDQVRLFFCDNARMWLRDFHIDGLRLDAVHAFVDRSAIHFLEQLSVEIDALQTELNRALVLIAESDLNDPRIVTPRELGGLGMDAQWSDDFHHALFSVLSGEIQGYYQDFGELSHLAKSLRSTYVYDGVYSKYRNRIHGRPVVDLPQSKFICFIQNHDQVGNRAIGDRLHEAAGFHRAKIGAAVLLTSPFVPLFFQGEEWAASSPFQYFANHDDAEMARRVREGRRQEFTAFGWDPNSIPDPESIQTFERSKLDWQERDVGYHREMLEWYRALIRLRRDTPALREADSRQVRVQWDEGSKLFSFARGEIVVICNLSSNAHRAEVSDHKKILLASRQDVRLDSHWIDLSSNSVVILG